MARGNKGVPSYFSNLLGVAPKGLLPLRTPRQASMSSAAETVAGSTRTTPVSATVPPVPPVKNTLPSRVTVPTAEIVPLPSTTDTSPVAHNALMEPSAAPVKHAAHPSFVEPVSTPLPHPQVQAPLPQQASNLFDSPMPVFASESEEGQSSPPRLGSILERAAARYLQEQELGGSQPMPPSVPPLPNNQAAPANRPTPFFSNQPAIQSPQARLVEPVIEIGHIEVRINPAPERTPAPTRPVVRGPLTRPHYLHGLRQS
jgi:hypothetical protein